MRAVLCIFALVGMKKGVIKIAVSLAAMIITIAVTTFAAPVLSEYIRNNTTCAELGDFKKAEECLDLMDFTQVAPQMDYGYQRACQLYKGIVKPEEYINEEEMAKVVLDRPNRVHFEESHMLYGLYWYWMIHGDEEKAKAALQKSEQSREQMDDVIRENRKK